MKFTIDELNKVRKLPYLFCEPLHIKIDWFRHKEILMVKTKVLGFIQLNMN